MNKDSRIIDEILEKYGKTIQVPLELLINPRYNKAGEDGRLRHNSAILYGLLTLLPKEKDDNGKEYVAITNEQMSVAVGTTNSVVTGMLKQLEDFNLIKREIKHGQKIYINEIER